ncbi:hypothetical protein AVEN_263629-1 [Araneus ventricosus]|uniref:Uncharacterized protein n=1 Tax=Araneus ventricosus TaxID=182803 RepID=A0A4Y2ATL3_ARAVE|nr:hypothetical protein AVEN_263629-1 [Araneus ventricosus]
MAKQHDSDEESYGILSSVYAFNQHYSKTGTDVRFMNEMLIAFELAAGGFSGFLQAKLKCGPVSPESPPGRQPTRNTSWYVKEDISELSQT